MTGFNIWYKPTKTSNWIIDPDTQGKSRALCAGLAAVMERCGDIYDVKIEKQREAA
jgi:hypothetical protein